MVTIDNVEYPYRRLYKLKQMAELLIHKPNSYFKHFSFIGKGNRIHSVGWNRNGCPGSVIEGRRFEYPLGGVHSESDAIAELTDLNICRKACLVNIRLNNQMELRNSKPCPICYNLIKTVGIKRVFYTTDIGFSYMEIR